MALLWTGSTMDIRPRINLPVAHWSIDCPDGPGERQPREHAVTCDCRKARTFHASGLCPACRAKRQVVLP